MAETTIDKKLVAEETKRVNKLLFNAKQQGLKHGRERFYTYGEIAEIRFDVVLYSRTHHFVYRYDPLNDSLYVVQ